MLACACRGGAQRRHLYQDKHTPNCQMSNFCIFFDNENEDLKLNSLEILLIILRKMKMRENLLTRNIFFDILNS